MSQVNTRDESDIAITQVLEKILLLNDEQDFVKDLIVDYGYPAWDKGIVSNATSDPSIQVVHIPLAFVSAKKISSYLLATITSDGTIEFAFVEGEFLDEIIKGGNIDFDISYHVAVFLTFNEKLYGNILLDYYEWLDAFTKDKLQNDEASVHTRCSVEIEICYEAGPIALQGEVETREINCYTVVLDCGSGDEGGFGISTIGNGTTSTGGWSTSSNGGGSSTGTNTETFQDFDSLKDLCAAIDGYTGDEDPDDPTGGLPTIDAETISACAALDYLSNSGYFTQGQIDAFIKNKLLIGVASYLQNNTGQYHIDLAIAYGTLLENGDTELGFKEFKKLYNLVVNELKPVLGLDEGEVSFLLITSDLANEINDFIESNNFEYSSTAIEASNIHIDLLMSDFIFN